MDQRVSPAPVGAAPGGQTDTPIPFEFTGSGGEYFKIWIVNLCLTVLTLGIYSAWAKVRRNRYFYGNTRLAGNAFEYLANPVAILKGRLIAVGFLLALSVSQHTSFVLYGMLTLVFLALLPWLIVRALAFRARNTAWRNIRFTFDGRYGQAFVEFLLLPAVLGLLTLGLAFPYIVYRQKRWFVAHSGYGRDRFQFDAALIDFYKVFGVLLLMVFGLFGAFFLLGGAAMAGLGAAAGPNGEMAPATVSAMMTGFAVLYGLAIVVYGFMFAYYNARIANIVYGATHIAGHGFEADLSPWGLFKVYVGNVIGIVLTLGLFIPWARVRVARYLADHLRLLPNGDLNEFVATQESAVAAVGEEMGEIFDIDIGL